MESRSNYAIGIAQAVGFCGMLWLAFAFPKPWDLQRVIGTVLLLIGIAGIIAARFQLGRSFSVTAQARQLVTRGIYSKIRNPIYVFGTLLIVSFVLILHKPAGWLFVAAMIIVQVIRARREAHVLESAFGDAYREYRQKTWF